MDVYYDLHLHSCLSPCGDMDMTPNNIINMAKLLNLNVIAITDHNTSLNAKAIMDLGDKENVLVIPGMELTTSEDIHVVCLFPSFDDAKRFSKYVEEHQIKIKNKEDIYGRQVIMDENDEETSCIDHLLILATDISIMDVKTLVESYNATCYPAHIDRDSYSILSVLGDIPKECGFNTFEISYDCDFEKLKERYPYLSDMKKIQSSDAHYLENMKEGINTLKLQSVDRKSVIEALK